MFKIDQEKINKYLEELDLKRKKDKQKNKREEKRGEKMMTKKDKIEFTFSDSKDEKINKLGCETFPNIS